MAEPAVRRVDAGTHDTPALLRDAAAHARLANALCSHDAGHDDFSTTTVPEVLGLLRERSDSTHDLFLAERGDDVVGTMTTMSLVGSPRVLEIDVVVDPARFDDRVADALLDTALAAAAARGLDVVQCWTLHRPRPAVRPLVPSTGVGVVDGADPLAAFLGARGFTLEQVERNSRFDLQGPLAPVARMLGDALAVCGPEYAVVPYLDVCPERHVESFARALSRMSTDAPQGGTVVEEKRMDGARIRRREARMQAQELSSLVTLAVHTPTGEVAAFNELVIGADRTAATLQYGTLVLPEHRGRRLGMVVKCAGLIRMHEVAPASRYVTTFNAEENDRMLAINVAIGFTPASYAGAWQRVGVAGSAGRSGSTGS